MTSPRAPRDFIKTVCPRDCYDACGILVAREGGAIRKVLGDPDHHVTRGALCGKCAIAYNGAWRDPSQRLASPLRRAGPRGSGQFEPIGWDEALAAIAARMSRLVAAGDARRIVHAHYTGTVALIGGWFPVRFFNHVGATEIDPDTVCNKAGHVALDYMFGASLDGFDPETAKDAATILVWGANPSHSAPHMNKHWLRETKARIIAIDPLAHRTAREVAHQHLQLRPGTDAALAFGFLNVAKRHGLIDRAFIAAHALGFDEIEPAIDAADLATTAALTGLEEEAIEAAALAYARGPSLLWLGQGMQRTARGGNAFRALAALVAGTGNLGKPGAGFCYMNGPATRGIDMNVLTAPESARSPGLVSHMELADVLADPARSQVFVTWNCNPLASSPDQARLKSGLARDDLFTVVCDLFMTDTAAMADIVLPAASFLECDDIVAPYFHHTLSAQVKAQEPVGEALPNQEIFRRLAAAMGLDEPALFEPDDALLARILAGTPFAGSFADLAAAGTVRLYETPRLQFAEGAFPTPSGRIEIASGRAAEAGLPRVPEPHADDWHGPRSLRILSPASNWQMNSSYANDPAIQAQLGAIAVLLHPADARSHGLASGDAVTLRNAGGALAVRVLVSDLAQPGVGVVYKGRWPHQEPGAANINLLHVGAKSDIGEATSVHSMLVELVPEGRAA